MNPFHEGHFWDRQCSKPLGDDYQESGLMNGITGMRDEKKRGHALAAPFLQFYNSVSTWARQ